MISFFLCSSVYPQYCGWLEREKPKLAEMSFAGLMKAIDADGFGWTESWRSGLEATGQYRVFVAYHGWKLAQKVWARENGVRTNSESWMADILAAQIEKFKPDVLFINGWELSAPYVQAIRRRFRRLRRVVGYDGVARHKPDHFRGTDIVLAPLRETAAFYQKEGFVGYFFKRGFDTGILGVLEKRALSIPASFIGSVYFGKNAHCERLRLLDYVNRHWPIHLFLVMQPWKQIPRIVASNIIHSRITSWWPLICDMNRYRRLAGARRPPVFGRAMYQTLADSAISLNCHIDVARNSAGNMRLFEATGVGSCLLTDWKSNLHEFFELDREIVAFRSAEECVERLKFLTQNPKQREDIARAGQQRTLKDHNLQTEIVRFAETLRGIL